MPAAKKTETPESTGPCPAVENPSEDEQKDLALGEETDADFDAEETEEETSA